MSNPNIHDFEASHGWNEKHRVAALRQEEIDEALLEARIAKATEDGKELFDADRVLDIYYPNDWTDDEERIRNRVESLRMEYYASDSMNIKEWVDKKEAIEAQGDS